MDHEIVEMLIRHEKRRLARAPPHLLVTRSTSLFTPVSGGGIVAAAMITPASMIRSTRPTLEPLPPCANNHASDCNDCRAECDECNDQEKENIVIVKAASPRVV